MFSTFRDLVEEITRLNVHLAGIRREWSELPPLKERVESLELARAQFEADMEGVFLKADGKLKAAASAEARERTMKKQYEHLLDPFGGDSSEETLPELERRVHGGDVSVGGDAPASEEEGLQPVHVVLATDYRQAALKSKFSL